MIALSDFTIYTKLECPTCLHAKSRLTEYGLTYQEIVIGEAITREQVIAQFPWVRTAPVVIDNKKNRFIEPSQLELWLKEHYDSD